MPSGNATHTITPSENKSTASPRRWLGGLLQSRVCLVPTWRGWALLALVVSFFLFLTGRYLCTLLTVNDPVHGGVLVIEGWVPTYAAQEALEEFHRYPYEGIYVTGEPFEEGNPYIGFRTFADFTVAKLVQMGAPVESIHAVPGPLVGRDRTFSMAATLRQRLEADGISTAKINVISIGSHSRRSRLLFRRAFGPDSQIGMMGLVDRNFDPNRWWQSSIGVRTVISETIAYLYVRFVFHPSAD
ncbi:MAG: hypothetical protein P4L99_08775 [Chthoniobacter sp.]|nr:hypothetical protein [Chthoniobacter sp.]